MAITIDSNPLSASANSYADIAFALTYFESRLHSAEWASTERETQKAALVHATRLLDRLVDWKGQINDIDQPLSWPRKYVKRRGRSTTGFSQYPDVYFNLDSFFDPAAADFPTFLREVCCELAFDLVREDRLSDQATGLSSLGVEGIRLTFKESDRKDIFSEQVVLMIGNYGRPTLKKSSTVKLVRA